jgi:hypothetical protein
MKKDLEVLPPILATTQVPSYYVIDLRRKVIYEYLFDTNKQSYPIQPRKISMNEIKAKPLTLKPVNIEIPFDII